MCLLCKCSFKRIHLALSLPSRLLPLILSYIKMYFILLIPAFLGAPCLFVPLGWCSLLYLRDICISLFLDPKLRNKDISYFLLTSEFPTVYKIPIAGAHSINVSWLEQEYGIHSTNVISSQSSLLRGRCHSWVSNLTLPSPRLQDLCTPVFIPRKNNGVGKNYLLLSCLFLDTHHFGCYLLFLLSSPSSYRALGLHKDTFPWSKSVLPPWYLHLHVGALIIIFP